MKVVWFTDYYQYHCFINTVLYSIHRIAKYNYYGNPRKLKLILDPYKQQNLELTVIIYRFKLRLTYLKQN